MYVWEVSFNTTRVLLLSIGLVTYTGNTFTRFPYILGGRGGVNFSELIGYTEEANEKRFTYTNATLLIHTHTHTPTVGYRCVGVFLSCAKPGSFYFYVQNHV